MDLTLQESAVLHKEVELEWLQQEYTRLLEHKRALEMRVLKSEERRRAFMHILIDLNTVTRKLADQRKAMIHILADYEKDRSRLGRQTDRLDNSRRGRRILLRLVDAEGGGGAQAARSPQVVRSGSRNEHVVLGSGPRTRGVGVSRLRT